MLIRSSWIWRLHIASSIPSEDKGWKTKDQFEEIWSLLIKVLVPSNNSELDNYDEVRSYHRLRLDSDPVPALASRYWWAAGY
ncbi:hypothetical protein LOD99_14560 [Oopsacas minuta]|uniref:Uncharacterized protein n=1 Tax=Oopsacas minuta TaxID=111878 RepID=A0AAV7KEK4_9METZ|nr:hypothetical protein LOD99_14560 [Oopsacas minuta]